MLEARGYEPLVATLCTFINKKSGMINVDHVDDFLVLGTEAQLFDLPKDLQVDFECSGQVLGYSSKCVKVLKCFGTDNHADQ